MTKWSVFESSSGPRDPGVAWLDEWSITWPGHAEAFLAVGRFAAQHFEDIDSSMGQDCLAFPICYLHRHALELKLKELLSVGREFLGEPSTVPENHDLRKLWSEARIIVEQCPVGKRDPYVDECDLRIEQIARVDPQPGTNFRYPEARDGGRPLPRDLKALDVAHFSEQLGEVCDYLEAWIIGLDESVRAQRDAAHGRE